MVVCIRLGKCNHCGQCCRDIVPKCASENLVKTEEGWMCSIYETAPQVCKDWPIAPYDIGYLLHRSKRNPCGFRFEEVTPYNNSDSLPS